VASFSVIDFILFVFALLLVVRASLRGFISEFMALASLVLGVLGAVFLHRSCAVFLRQHGLEEALQKTPEFLQKLLPGLVNNIPEIIAFVAVFAVIFVLVKLAERLLKDITERISLGAVDRFLGLLFGVAEGIAVISLVLLIIRIQPIFDTSSLLENSFFAKMLFPLIIRGNG
jgi:membrane protein required for colicin V production